MSRSVRSDIPWRQSFAVRFAVVWAVVLGGAVGFSGWLSHRDARILLMENLQQTVERDAGVIVLRLETWLQTLGEDTRSLSKSPLVGEFLEVRNSPAEERWRELVEDGFRAVFAGKPTYIQMRLLQIGGVGEGREIVRLDRRGSELVVTPADQLQQKGGRGYFQEALSLAEGQIYFSEINLNRDFGEITIPQVPTIRAAMKIGTPSGQRAMLIINADLRLLFSELRELASPGAELDLADEKGDYLMHPEEGATFGSDLGHGVRFESGKKDAQLSVEREVATGQWPGRVLFLRVKLPDGVWRATLEQSRRRGIWATGWATLAGAVLALLIAWPFAHRLGTLSKALRLFDGTGDLPSQAFGDPRQDEIGVAIERFREMAAKVSEYVEDLHRARHEAEEANAAKETFLAVMSHEIRTPMNAVVGLIRALEANDPPARQEPILNSLRSSTDNLMTLLNTALDFTRLQERVMSFAVEDFDAAVVARDVVTTLKPLAMAKNLAFDVEAPSSLPVQGDSVRLRQVMNNLLNNALKFTQEGAVNLSLSYEKNQLVGRVRDTGPGICEEDRARIFTPFFTRESGFAASGAGLGLSVSKGLLEQQGGELHLEPSSGNGACFVFTLPYPPGAVEGEKASGRAEAAVRAFPEGLRILYVEDTPSNQEVMRLTLEGTGIDLRCVGTAGEAFEEFEEAQFDLVMVDLQLPDMSGADLAGRLLERAPGIPIIAVTAQGSAAADGLLRAAGICEMILKPYTNEQVLGTLSRMLPGNPAAGLAGIHPDDLEKAARLGRMMAQEFQESAAEIRKAGQSGSNEEKQEVLRAVRHRLTTAFALFPLERVERAFSQMDSAGISDRSQFDELEDALKEAAELLGCDRLKAIVT